MTLRGDALAATVGIGIRDNEVFAGTFAGRRVCKTRNRRIVVVWPTRL